MNAKHLDKLMHFAGGVLVALFGLGLSHFTRGQFRPSDAVGLALLVGIAKEAFDYVQHRRAVQRAAAGNLEMPTPLDMQQSVLDAVATLAGGVVVGVIAGLITGQVA